MASYTISNSPLSGSELKANAQWILNWFAGTGGQGWTKNAVCGMLGNMQYESTINPGVWQGYTTNPDPSVDGYGLVQWTPATNYTDWAAGKGFPDDMIGEVNRIIYELNNGLQWYATSSYNLTFQQFTQSTQSASYLASAWIHDYERPASYSSESTRQSYATNWYNTLTVGASSGGGGGPGHGTIPPPSGGQGAALMHMYLSGTLRDWIHNNK